ncbi:3-oxoacyl-[acyl-carrier-protein] reductase [Lachnellula subtilissima]|uniref:3-oxoacyl-[acyl-carrier-protein] reductase n=1 Tax=Lachnellula subtilissima TaxID=602034 RepID=A0A8H8U9Q1_9HELO|nr:3-oxoacyl-[acyl-carrier-protein] reductase [Lachnellula subtilissima]
MSQSQIAVITGGSRGIGAAVALTLASKGMDIAIVYTSQSSTPQAEELSKQITALGRRALLVRTDLSAADCGVVVRDAVLKGFQTEKIDVLVNNAGITGIQDSLSIELDHYVNLMNINLRAPMLLVQAIAPHMNRGGRIISMSSVLAHEPVPGYDVYAVTKSGIEALTRQWAITFGKSAGLTANAIVCGAVETDIIKDVPRELFKTIMEKTAADYRIGTTDDIAQVAAFFG